ncbi:hypothetical protein [Acinetobacter faecalis]|uniref:Transcriptional regulator n=1 Tax=Acinetobacter faecalis TaxID=2665161 RepID=A0ABU5GGT6_9GAMM|nr:hypothetical protein [Acinetobacter faecalis]MDY6549756.1 hypothetical protein [Acinetobacter faecalis]
MFQKSDERKKARIEEVQKYIDVDFENAAQHNFDVLAEEALAHLQNEKNGKSK